MADPYSMASRYVSTAATAAYSMSYSTNHVGWGSKWWNFFLSCRESSWNLFPLCFDSLVQLVLILCWSGLLLECLSSSTLVVLLEFEISYLLGFTVIFVWVLTWGSERSLSSPSDIWIKGNCSEYFFIRSNWLVWSDVGLLSFSRCLDGLIIDNVETSWKIYSIIC